MKNAGSEMKLPCNTEDLNPPQKVSRRGHCSGATSSTTSLPWSHPELTPALCDENSASNPLGYSYCYMQIWKLLETRKPIARLHNWIFIRVIFSHTAFMHKQYFLLYSDVYSQSYKGVWYMWVLSLWVYSYPNMLELITLLFGRLSHIPLTSRTKV
jgi:hypothetical protein